MFRRLSVSLILVAAMAMAQRGGGGGGGMGEGGGEGGMGGGGGMGGMGGGGGMMRVAPKTKLELFAEKLKLSKEQSDELVKILAAGREEATPIRGQMESGRVAITNAMLKGNPDDTKKFVEAYGNLAGQMAGVEAKVFAKVFEILKPNQQSKAGQAFPYLAGIYDPAGGRGGAGRGMGGNRGGGGRK